ncbi:MAG: DUF2963 domain-containing protein [Candidatus Phytoplasma sp. TWB_XP]
MIFKFNNRYYRLIPFLITVGILLFCFILIIGASYKYHLETEERRILLTTDVKQKAIELNEQIHQENQKLKGEMDKLKSVPYEITKDNGDKEYYSLITTKLVKKIDSNGNIWEYNPDNGLLVKEIDKYNNITEYDSHSKIIRRKNIDGSLEEFDSNGKKIETEVDKPKDNPNPPTSNVKHPPNIVYNSDGKTINEIIEFNQLTGNPLRSVFYTDSGKTLMFINDYDKSTGNIFKKTYYQPDGKTIKKIYYYEEENGIVKEIHYYNPNGTIYKK